MRLSIFLGSCAAAAIALPLSTGAIAMQRGQDSDRGTVNRVDRGAGIQMRQGKDTVDRFQANTVGTRIRQENHPTHPDHPTHDPHDTPTDPHHPTTDPHDTPTDPHHPATDPHDMPTDPHHSTTDPHDTPTDPHHPTTDPHDTDPHHSTPG